MEYIDVVISNANKAFPKWKSLTVRERVKYLINLKNQIKDNLETLTKLISSEHGKLYDESKAEVLKSIETLEFAEAGILLLSGKSLEVSKGIRCEERRESLGIVVSICPFNFPMMVPFWTLPIALMTGNCLIIKPSEKVPKTMKFINNLINESGFPKGVFSVVNGEKEVVEKLITEPLVKAVTFVGSTPVAKIVGKIATDHGKKTLCLGGAKNHLVVLPDADMELTANDVVRSFCGCTGQRCMAASVLILVGSMKLLLEKIKEKSKLFKMGMVIDNYSKIRIQNIITEMEDDENCKIYLDGRQSGKLRPTIVIHKNRKNNYLDHEIFGPVLSVIQVNSLDEAIKIENESKFGNAACIYTQSGGKAEYCIKKFNSGMVGVNVGVPVPREPFSFGGFNESNLYGKHDITGMDGVNFFTNKKKVTTRWGRDPSIFE